LTNKRYDMPIIQSFEEFTELLVTCFFDLEVLPSETKSETGSIINVSGLAETSVSFRIQKEAFKPFKIDGALDNVDMVLILLEQVGIRAFSPTDILIAIENEILVLPVRDEEAEV
jgi:hypothetical protein